MLRWIVQQCERNQAENLRNKAAVKDVSPAIASCIDSVAADYRTYDHNGKDESIGNTVGKMLGFATTESRDVSGHTRFQYGDIDWASIQEWNTLPALIVSRCKIRINVVLTI
jgi:hypothetical protein